MRKPSQIPSFEPTNLDGFVKLPGIYRMIQRYFSTHLPQYTLPPTPDEFLGIPELQGMFFRHIPPFTAFIKSFVSEDDTWEEGWGQSWLSEPFRNYLSQMQHDGSLQGVVLDVGSSAHPVTAGLDRTLCRVIEVDCAARGESPRALSMLMRADIELVFRGSAAERLPYERSVAAFLGLDPAGECDPRQLDAVVLSQLIKYVDYLKVIDGLLRYLKPGAELYVLDIPSRRVPQLESPQGLKKGREMDLFNLLLLRGFTIKDYRLSENEFVIRAQYKN